MEVSDCLWNPPNCPRIQVSATCDRCIWRNSLADTYKFVLASPDLIETHYTDNPQSHSSILSLSRSHSSASAFAPGAHRRSHPNLQHLSLAPLTPKYPINPSDYDAYFNPDTSQLHTSTSLSHIAGLPSPGGILTNSPTGSRAASRTRSLKRKARSTVAFKALEKEETSLPQARPRASPHGAVTSQGFGGTIAPTVEKSTTAKPGSHLRLRINPHKPDPSWFVQTGLALTEGSRESKGQSWLVKRASSTSLHTPPEDSRSDVKWVERPMRSPYVSGRNTPNRSRRSSRDRRRSRRELAMTPATAMSPSTPRPAGSFLQVTETGTDDPALSRLITTESHGQGYSGPDWVDSQTQAEIAAELEGEMAAELEPAELYDEDDEDKEWWREDRYEAVDFEGHWDEDEKQDEVEIQRAVRERGFGVGRWVDGVVDAFLRLDDNDSDEERDLEVGIPEGIPHNNSEQAPAESRATGEGKDGPKSSTDESSGHVSDDAMEPAPAHPASVWEDVAWFSRLVFKTARS
jgi:hypothetical protein